MSVANGMGLNSKVQILMVSEFENDIMSTTKNYNRIETFIMTSTNNTISSTDEKFARIFEHNCNLARERGRERAAGLYCVTQYSISPDLI